MAKPSRLEYAVAILLGPRYALDPRTVKAWPGVDELSSADRKAVVRATRRGRDIGDARLASAITGYGPSVRRRWLDNCESRADALSASSSATPRWSD